MASSHGTGFVRPIIAGSSLITALVLGIQSSAHADPFRLQNDTTDHQINFTIAERYDDCLYGLIDRNWFVLNPGQSMIIDIDFFDRFFIGATSLDLNGKSEWVMPFGNTANDHIWEVPFSGSSNGSCSIVLEPPRDGSNPVLFPHFELNGFLFCPATAQARAVNLPEGGITFELSCSDRPGLPGGKDGGTGQ
jgi:hypothetical protein